MDWIAVFYLCSAAAMTCDARNAYDRFLFSPQRYPSALACQADAPRQRAALPTIESGLRITLTCEETT